MEIDYNIIIKYLENNNNTKKNKKNEFEIKKHLIKYNDLFPQKFNDILQNKFYYYGVTEIIEKKNVGFFMSILTLLNKDFITYNQSEEIDYMNTFKSSINSKIINSTEFTFSLEVENYIKNNNINKKNIINNINVLLIQCISEILSSNFIIFDFKDEQIYTIYPDTVLNPYKSTLLFANYDDLWYPIIYELNSKRIFSYNDIYIKKIYSIDIQYYDKININKCYEMTDNVKEIINTIEEPELNIEDSTSESINENDNKIDNSKIDNNLFIKNENKIELNKNKLLKMTKIELLEILKNRNINNVSMKILKNDLIEMILKN